ncbi:Tuberous sclerosis 1, partial [Rhizoctonia solani]
MSATTKDILTHIRSTFNTHSPPQLTDLRPLIDVYISETAHLEPELDNGLLDIYSQAIDHSDVSHIAAFIGVLYAFRMVLSSASIISWFDSLLRRALREPRLDLEAVKQAKDLVLMPLYDESETKAQLLRRRLVQLYVLDAPRENDSAVETMTQSADERAKMAVWETNLEDLLVSDGFTRPKELFEELDVSFKANPESRLQLCILLNRFSRSPRKVSIPFVNSPLFSTLLISLQVDQSTTVFSIAITSLIMLLPALAVDAPAQLNTRLPALLTILGRIVCWKLRSEGKEGRRWKVKPELEWKRLDTTFESAAPSETRLYFTFMYGLYPCNTIAFLRSPVTFLRTHGHASMFTHDWDVVLDEDEIKSCSRPLLRGHVVHPSIILADAKSELADLTRWKDKDIATVAAECTLLDIQNAQTSAGHSIAYYIPPTPQASSHPTPQASGNHSLLPPESAKPAKIPLPPSPAGSIQPPPPPQPQPQPADPSASPKSTGGRSEKSLEIMINTHATLTAPPGPLLFLADTPAPAAPASTTVSPRPRHAMAEEALSILQRDVLILRNQLNFEIYLKELVQQHVGRLHQDKIVSRSEEAERQSLHVKLKDYKAKLTKAQEDLATTRAEAAGTKSRHTQWVTELQDKLTRFREEKRSWAAEAVELRGEVNDARAALKAQNEALADALNEVFNLKQQLRESAPKVDKIAAYEQRIDQLVKAQALRDDSPEMRAYREDRGKLDEMISNYAKMELQLQSLQHANEQLTALHKTQEDELNNANSQVTDLTRRLASATTQNPFSRSAIKAAAAAQDQINKLEAENKELSNKNMVLMDEIDEVKAMVEFLRSERVNFGAGGPGSPVQRIVSGTGTLPAQTQSEPVPGTGPSPRLDSSALADLADATAAPGPNYLLMIYGSSSGDHSQRQSEHMHVLFETYMEDLRLLVNDNSRPRALWLSLYADLRASYQAGVKTSSPSGVSESVPSVDKAGRLHGAAPVTSKQGERSDKTGQRTSIMSRVEADVLSGASSNNQAGSPGLGEGPGSVAIGDCIPASPLVLEPNFSYSDGNIELQISNHRFWVHEFLLSKFAKFAELIRQARGRGEFSTDPERRTVLRIPNDVKVQCEDFRNTFLVIYSTTDPIFSEASSVASCDQEALAVSKWISTLRVATFFENPGLRIFAISQLEPKSSSIKAVRRIALSDELMLPKWELLALTELCRRREPISLDEANTLGITRFVEIARIRERAQHHQYIKLIDQATKNPFLNKNGTIKKDDLEATARELLSRYLLTIVTNPLPCTSKNPEAHPPS